MSVHHFPTNAVPEALVSTTKLKRMNEKMSKIFQLRKCCLCIEQIHSISCVKKDCEESCESNSNVHYNKVVVLIFL